MTDSYSLIMSLTFKRHKLQNHEVTIEVLNITTQHGGKSQD